MISLVLRVWMPDRPGALGQVASRIGAVRGDVLGIEILERGGGQAIDELTIALPSTELITLLTEEIDDVDSVSVEEVRAVDLDRADLSLSALAAGAALAEADPAERLDVLCASVQRLVDADWAVVLHDDEVVAHVGASPDIAWLLAFLAGSEHLSGHLPEDPTEGSRTLPDDLVWGHLLSSGLIVAAGRSGRSIRERERVRVSLLTRLADALD